MDNMAWILFTFTWLIMASEFGYYQRTLRALEKRCNELRDAHVFVEDDLKEFKKHFNHTQSKR